MLLVRRILLQFFILLYTFIFHGKHVIVTFFVVNVLKSLENLYIILDCLIKRENYRFYARSPCWGFIFLFVTAVFALSERH